MTSNARHVLVLGDANVDLTLHVPDRRPEGRGEVREPILSGGGTAANTAAALARLGVPVSFVGAVGDDAFGRWVAADLAAMGVGVAGLVAVEPATCQVIAMLEPDGERSLVVWPTDGGALRWLRPEDIPIDEVAGAAWLHTTGMCLRHAPARDAVLAAMAMARSASVPVSIDLNLRVELWGLADERLAAVEQAVGLADVVLGSGPEELVPLAAAMGARIPTGAASALTEAGAMTLVETGGPNETGGRGATDAVWASGERAVRAISGGRRTVVARFGTDGVLACAPDGSLLRVPAYAVAAANIVGAGDAFNGGFVAAMVEGRGLAAALRWGNAVAAGRVARPGGARDLPTREEVEALLG